MKVLMICPRGHRTGMLTHKTIQQMQKEGTRHKCHVCEKGFIVVPKKEPSRIIEVR